MRGRGSDSLRRKTIGFPARPKTKVFGVPPTLLPSNVEECADTSEREIGNSCEREIRAVGVILFPTGESSPVGKVKEREI